VSRTVCANAPVELEGTTASRDTYRGAMSMLNDDETRSLEALARATDGCAEAVLLADGLTIKQLSGLVINGFATLERRRANVGGGKGRCFGCRSPRRGERRLPSEASGRANAPQSTWKVVRKSATK
jgi:hypothetical protein